jgi:hypothetical protein
MDACAALWLIVVVKGRQRRQREVLHTVPASPDVH